MKRLILILIPVLLGVNLMASGVDGTPIPADKLKLMLERVSGGIVQVVADAGKVYVGTGIALEPDMVLTSALLVPKLTAGVVVIRSDERRFPARLKGRDARTSVALLQLESPVLTPIPRAQGVEVGDWIVLVGAFYNRFPAVQQGMISSVSEDALILNAAAVPGSSGGAILNEQGRLVAVMRGRFGYATTPDIRVESESGGMTFLGRKFNSGDLSYAIPIERVVDLAEQLKRYGHVPRGWAGLRLTMSGSERALRVLDVQPGSPAERAGLLVHDRILSINGREVATVADVFRAMRESAPGDSLRVDVQRDKLRKGILLTLEERPDERAEIELSETEIGRYAPGDFDDTLPAFRRFVFQHGKAESPISQEFRRRMREMAVSVHHRSLEPIRRELRRLSWKAELMENGVEQATTAGMDQLRNELHKIETRVREILESRKKQLEEDRRAFARDMESVRKRLEALKKTAGKK